MAHQVQTATNTHAREGASLTDEGWTPHINHAPVQPPVNVRFGSALLTWGHFKAMLKKRGREPKGETKPHGIRKAPHGCTDRQDEG